MSEETAEVMLKGIDTVAHYKGVLIWMRVHSSSCVLSSEKDHMELKTVKEIFDDAFFFKVTLLAKFFSYATYRTIT